MERRVMTAGQEEGDMRMKEGQEDGDSERQRGRREQNFDDNRTDGR